MTNAGIDVAIGPYRGALNPDFDTPEFRAAVSDPRSLASGPSARVLLDRRNLVSAASVPVSPSGSVEAVVKMFRASGFKRLKTLLVPGKAARAWRGAAACRARSVPTPLPMAYLERRARGLVVEGYYFSAYLADAVEIRSLLRELQPDDLGRLLTALAKFLVFFHNEGILHRDLSDGNILVRSPRPGAYDLCLIDTNRIRVRRSISVLVRLRNLVRLGVPPAYQDLFLRLYLGAGRASRPLVFWYRANKAWYAGFVAFKKKLRLRRLAERLGIQ
jgi:tRNA A-37 threonylcarbamoyl transferase component Bud32